MLYMWIDSVVCDVETDEVGEDEPYLIVLAVDLKNTVKATGMVGGVSGSVDIPIPASAAALYGPLTDFDAGEAHAPPFAAFWGLNGGEMALASPDDSIFVAALMENDNGSPKGARGLVASQAQATLLATQGADRATRVRRLVESTVSALSIPTGGPGFDELVGVQELRFEQSDLDLAETGQSARKTLSFEGDGGKYRVSFQARKRGQTAWRFCAKCRCMFFIGFFPQKGVCAAGGSHGEAGFTFFLRHDESLPNAESGWRFCTKCFGMFKRAKSLGSALGDPGICPAGGGHESQGFVFVLPHAHPGGQDGWTRCGKCRALFFDGEANKGVCPAGGPHDRARTLQGTPVESFKLDFER